MADYRRTEKHAASAFSDHRIRSRGDRRWLLQSRHRDYGWEIAFSTEIIATAHRGLYVGGDIDSIVFAYGPESASQRVSWVATSSLDYLVSKACVGTYREAVWEWQYDAAVEDCKQAVADDLVDNPEHDPKAASDMIESLRWAETQDQVVEAYMKFDPDIEMAGDLGMRVHSRVIYAVAAVKRLNWLLSGKVRYASVGTHYTDGCGAAAR